MRSVIESQDLETSAKTYWGLKKDHGDKYDFSEGQLNRLASEYLRKEEMKKAIAVFNLNAEAYPESSTVFYNLAEAYQKDGSKEKAVENYKKSLVLNPGNQQLKPSSRLTKPPAVSSKVLRYVREGYCWKKNERIVPEGIGEVAVSPPSGKICPGNVVKILWQPLSFLLSVCVVCAHMTILK